MSHFSVPNGYFKSLTTDISNRPRSSLDGRIGAIDIFGDSEMVWTVTGVVAVLLLGLTPVTKSFSVTANLTRSTVGFGSALFMMRLVTLFDPIWLFCLTGGRADVARPTGRHGGRESFSAAFRAGYSRSFHEHVYSILR